MKRKRLFIGWWVACSMVIAVSCQPTAPQRPSQRKGAEPIVDSAQLALLELNQHLASTADMQLAQLAQELPEQYALYEGNTWLAVLHQGDTNQPTPKENEEWTVRMRIYDLDGRLMMDSEGNYRIGKHELPKAVEETIGGLHPGCKAKLLAPWYAAYGIQGNEYIAPYQNVIIELELK